MQFHVTSKIYAIACKFIHNSFATLVYLLSLQHEIFSEKFNSSLHYIQASCGEIVNFRQYIQRNTL